MDLVPTEQSAHEVDLANPDNPRSVINLVAHCPRVRDAILAVPKELLDKTADELRELQGKDWNLIDHRLRSSFWLEYQTAQEGRRKMRMPKVYDGVCPVTYFYTRILPDPVRLAHLLLPPPEYRLIMEDALTCGIQRLREILEMPIYQTDRKTGKLDKTKPLPNVAAVILKTVQTIDDRLKGTVVHRFESKSVNVNVEAQNGAPETVEAIDQRLRELEAKAQAVVRGPGVIDVEHRAVLPSPSQEADPDDRE